MSTICQLLFATDTTYGKEKYIAACAYVFESNKCMHVCTCMYVFVCVCMCFCVFMWHVASFDTTLLFMPQIICVVFCIEYVIKMLLAAAASAIATFVSIACSIKKADFFHPSFYTLNLLGKQLVAEFLLNKFFFMTFKCVAATFLHTSCIYNTSSMHGYACCC